MGLLLGLGILRQVSILTLALFISFLNHMFKKNKTPFCLLTHVAFPQCKKKKEKKKKVLACFETPIPNNQEVLMSDVCDTQPQL